jgi:hypothetical protein
MKILTTKQLVNQLYKKITNPVLNYTDEQVQLIIKLQQSFETDEERAERIAKFKQMVNK